MRTLAVVFALAIAPLAGCVESGGSASTAQVTQSQRGTIVSMRQVTTGPSQADQIAGAVAGGLVGGIVGNQFGGGSGRDAMTALGAVGGAAAGSRMAANANTQVVPEWTVRLEDGRTIAIVQNEAFRIGQNVTVVSQGNSIRIVP